MKTKLSKEFNRYQIEKEIEYSKQESRRHAVRTITAERILARHDELARLLAQSLLIGKNRLSDLQRIALLSTNWKHGNEGVHLLRIDDIASKWLETDKEK